jgi:putative nucleotidyltransferase-like protein
VDPVCRWLREDAPGSAAPTTLAAADRARAHRIHLLLADRYALSEFADELRAAAALDAAREPELRSVIAALAEATPVLIKGAALAYTHYQRPELRPREDTDLLISGDDKERVAAALEGLGYQRTTEVDGLLVTGQFHFQRHDGCGVRHVLDVHWKISNVRAFAEALSYDEIIAGSAAMPRLGPAARVPSAVHSLVVACAHRVAHHGDTDQLLWLFDIHLLARSLTVAERDQFTALVTKRRLRAVAAKGLAAAAAAFGGIDTRWLAVLQSASAVAEPSAAFIGGPMRRVEVLTADLAATARWRDRVRLLREHLFPAAAFMYQRYGTRRAAALPILYAHRIVSGAPKWFRR